MKVECKWKVIDGKLIMTWHVPKHRRYHYQETRFTRKVALVAPVAPARNEHGVRRS